MQLFPPKKASGQVYDGGPVWEAQAGMRDTSEDAAWLGSGKLPAGHPGRRRILLVPGRTA